MGKTSKKSTNKTTQTDSRQWTQIDQDIDYEIDNSVRYDLDQDVDNSTEYEIDQEFDNSQEFDLADGAIFAGGAVTVNSLDADIVVASLAGMEAVATGANKYMAATVETALDTTLDGFGDMLDTVEHGQDLIADSFGDMLDTLTEENDASRDFVGGAIGDSQRMTMEALDASFQNTAGMMTGQTQKLMAGVAAVAIAAVGVALYAGRGGR